MGLNRKYKGFEYSISEDDGFYFIGSIMNLKTKKYVDLGLKQELDFKTLTEIDSYIKQLINKNFDKFKYESYKEKLNKLYEASGRLLYAHPEGPDQLAVDVSYGGKKYGGIIPLIK